MTHDELLEANYGRHLPILPMFYVTPDRPLTESRIEREVERLYDFADDVLLSGKATQAQYERWSRNLARWASEQLTSIK